MDVAQLGIQVDSAAALKGAANLDKLTVSAARAEDAAQDLAAASRGVVVPLNNVARGSALAGNGARMMGQQLSQVAQQTAATGNFVQALAIQLPDMALGFGVWGMAIAAVASVALPALVSVLGEASEKGKEMKETLDAMEDAVGAYSKAVEAASAPNDELAASYGRLATEARGALLAMAQVGEAKAIAEVGNAVTGVVASLTEMREFASSSGFLGATESVRVLKDTLGMTQQEAATVRLALDDLANAQGMEAQAIAAAAARDALRAAYDSVQAMPAPIQEAYEALAKVALNASTAEQATLALAMQTSGVADAAAMAAAQMGNIGAAAQGAIGAVAALGNAILQAGQAANALTRLENHDLAAQYANYGKGRQAGVDLANSGYKLPGTNKTKKAGSRGGGGSKTINPELREAQQLFDSTRTAAEKYGIEAAKVAELHAKFPALITDDVQARALENLREKLDDTKDSTDDLKNSFKDMFQNILDGSMSAGEALSNLLSSFASNLLSSGLDALWDGLGLGSLFKNAKGNAFQGGNVIPFAKGGVVNGPTLFGMKGGTGLMGEAGPEAILPLSRGADGKLGVQSAGGGTPAVNVSINVDARGAVEGVAEQVARAVQAHTPAIVKQAVAGVGAARQRGYAV